jgi:hypothetical protein
MYRSFLTALTLSALMAFPAVAQESQGSQGSQAPNAGATPPAGQSDVLVAAKKLYGETKISPEADLALYCGAGFHLLAGIAAAAQNSEAPSFERMSQTLLARADGLLEKEGLSFEQRSKLAEAVTVVANSQVLRAEEKPRYSKDDCTAAVPSGQ